MHSRDENFCSGHKGGDKTGLHSSAKRLHDEGLEHGNRRPQRILLVDDEELIGLLAGEMLSDMGFLVTVERDSVKALETFRADPEKFDLVITDQSMPGLTGCDLALAIRTVRQDIPIIFCTGFTVDMDLEENRDLNIAAVCTKPLEFDLFLQTINTALAG